MRFWLDGFGSGVRTLLRNPGITLLLSLLIGLGTGANAAVFSLVDACLLRALPFPDAGHLVTIWEANLATPDSRNPLTPDQYTYLEGQARSFESLGAWVAGEDVGFDLQRGRGSERVSGAAVSPGFFRVLGVRPALGRVFLPEEDEEGGRQVVVLGHGLWQRRFGADPAILGKTIELSGSAWTVVGIMPSSFHYPDVALWVPRPLEVDRAMRLPLRTTYRFRAIARLRRGVSLEQAQEELHVLSRAGFEDQEGGKRFFRVISLRDAVLGSFRSVLLLLFGAVGIVFLTACSNVANLSLAWLLAREREIAIRCALGANRSRLAAQLAIESLLLGLLGAVAGLLLGTWSLHASLPFFGGLIPPGTEIRLNIRVIAFTLTVATLSGLLSGPFVALIRSRNDPSRQLRDMAANATSQAGQRLSTLLVVAQLALVFVLVAGEGVMLRSMAALGRLPLGFEPRHVLTLETVLNKERYPSAPDRLAFTAELMKRLQALPGVEAVAVSNGLPLKGGGLATLYGTEGEHGTSPESLPITDTYSVSPSFFQALGIPLRQGRSFKAFDRADSPPVVILEETLARRLWPQEDAIGRRLEIQGVWREVVGVAAPIRHRGPREPESTLVYMPLSQLSLPWPFYHIVIRVKGDPLKAAPPVLAALHQVDPYQPVSAIASLEKAVAASSSIERRVTLVLGVFALTGSLLALTGVYALVSFATVRRRREIGLRIALGAGRRQVLSWLARQVVALAAAGLAAGAGLALGTTQALRRFLFGVAPLDPWAFLGAMALLLGVVFAAVLLPARRALRLDPATVLRSE